MSAPSSRPNTSPSPAADRRRPAAVAAGDHGQPGRARRATTTTDKPRPAMPASPSQPAEVRAPAHRLGGGRPEAHHAACRMSYRTNEIRSRLVTDVRRGLGTVDGMTTELPDTELPQTEDEWRVRLNPAEFRVLRQAGTEPAWTGEYTDTKTSGVYRCRACGAELFSSDTKFDSHCGWPSFDEALPARSATSRTVRTAWSGRRSAAPGATPTSGTGSTASA